MTDGDTFDELVDNLRKVFFALRGISNQMLEELGCTVVERGILKELDTSGAQTVPVLAEARAVSRQAMQKAIDGLVAQKLVVVTPNPRHRRSPLIAIAPAGAKLLHAALAREKRALANVSLPVSDAEIKRTSRVLSELATYFDAMSRRKS